MTGLELRELLQQKWGFSFAVQLRKVKGKILFQVMWRYLEQVSFPLTEMEYLEHLEAVTNYLNDWGGSEQVRSFIIETKEKPRLGKAVSLILDLGARASEWLL